MKNIKLKNLITGAALIFGLSSAAAISQTVSDPWTGSIPGDNFYFSTANNLKQIRALLNKGHAEKAVVFAKQNVKSIDSESRSGRTSKLRYDAYNALCLALMASKKYDDAKEACDTAIKDSPKRWMAYNSRGSLNLRNGNFSDASSDYRIAIENAPSKSDIKSLLKHNMNLAQNRVSPN